MNPLSRSCAAALSAMLFGQAAGAQGRCVVHGALPIANGVQVAVPGEAPLVLDVEDADADAALPDDAGGAVSVSLRAALRVEGVAPAVSFALRRDTALARGALRLAPSAAIERVRASAGGGAAFDAVIGPSVTVIGVEAPCDAVRLGPPETSPATTFGQRVTRELRAPSPAWRPAREVLTFFARPSDGAGVRVSFARREDSWANATPLIRLRRAGAWSEVLLAANEGAVRGWVEQSALRSIGSGWSSGGSASSACGGCGGDAPVPREPGDYLGPATIAPGAEVRAAPNGPRWATVLRADGFRVHARPGQAWVRVVAIPGVRATATCFHNLERAWVPRDAVRTPDVDAGR